MSGEDSKAREKPGWIVRPSKKENVPSEKMTSPEQTEPNFETADLNLASFLYCRNFPFLGIKRLGNASVVCVFADSPELRYALVDYANDGVVPVRTFKSTLRYLKILSR